MGKILLLHGANLNFLGRRNTKYYGTLTLADIVEVTNIEAAKFNFKVIAYQSNHEGCLIDKLQAEASSCVGLIINPGAFTHYSYALYDAILDAALPSVEVHLSNIKKREGWRKRSITAQACIGIIAGKKEEGYKEAIKILAEYLNNANY